MRPGITSTRPSTDWTRLKPSRSASARLRSSRDHRRSNSRPLSRHLLGLQGHISLLTLQFRMILARRAFFKQTSAPPASKRRAYIAVRSGRTQLYSHHLVVFWSLVRTVPRLVIIPSVGFGQW